MEHSLVKISKALIPAMSSSLSVLAAYISLLMLSGCTSIDPKFDALQPHIQTSPVPNEIVGMWNRKSPEDISTIFFKADGTAFQKNKFRAWPVWHDFPTWQFKYVYAGGGVWTCSEVIVGGNWDSNHAAPALGTKFQLAKGSLLMSRKNPPRQFDTPI